MSNTSHSPATQSAPESGFGRFLRATEIDPRLLGMVGALVLIWVAFEAYSTFVLGRPSMLLGAAQADANGFLTPRNLWNLSVQTAYIGIMATGMVLVIITRNIDLSVGSIMGMVGMYMGLLQVDFLTPALGLGHPAIWVVTVIFGIVMGALIGALQGGLEQRLASLEGEGAFEEAYALRMELADWLLQDERDGGQGNLTVATLLREQQLDQGPVPLG